MSIPEFQNSMPITRHNAHDTNVAAAQRLFPKMGQRKYQLVEAHVAAGPDGLTDHEAAAILGPRVAWSTAGATRHALNRGRDHDIEWFEPTDVRRTNENGSTCIVWQFTKDARKLLGATW